MYKCRIFFIFFALIKGASIYASNTVLPAEEGKVSYIRYCLSIDGGGLKGVIPATILSHIEDSIHPHKISEVFKGGITGTSTGALIALGLAARKSIVSTHPDYKVPMFTAERLINFYESEAKKIFECWTPSNCWNNCSSCEEVGCTFWCQSISNILTCWGCFGCCKNCNGIYGPKYSSAYLKEHLDKEFGGRLMKDALVDVQIVAFNVDKNEPIYFSNIHTPNVKMVDAAMASAAAPTYFPPYKFENPDYKIDDPENKDKFYRCVDGGIFENNPGYAALKFAVEIYRRDHKPEPEIKEFRLVSIGTGQSTVQSDFMQLSRAGKIGWAPKVIKMTMAGTSKAADSHLTTLYAKRKDGRLYYRLQVPIEKKYSKMDSPDNVAPLKRVTKTAINPEDGKDTELAKNLKELIDALKAYLVPPKNRWYPWVKDVIKKSYQRSRMQDNNKSLSKSVIMERENCASIPE
jgi:patatin-like phospholipase/acyl hydrolase